MMDIITGKTKPDTGRVFFGQTIDLLKLDEQAIARIGIGRKFQKPTVIEPLTVLENLELAMSGAKPLRGLMTTRLTGEERDRCWAKAVALYPGYRGYAERAGREIPVVVVETEDAQDIAAPLKAIDEPERDYGEFLDERGLRE